MTPETEHISDINTKLDYLNDLKIFRLSHKAKLYYMINAKT